MKKVLKLFQQYSKDQVYLIADEGLRTNAFNSLSLGPLMAKREREDTDRTPQSSLSAQKSMSR